MEATGQRCAAASEVPTSGLGVSRSAELEAVLSGLDATRSSAALDAGEGADEGDEFAAVHEQLILRFVAPALGAALDEGTLDRARMQVFLRECVGCTNGVIVAAVTAVLPDARALSLDELADRLAEELDRAEQLDTGGLDHAEQLDTTDVNPAPGPPVEGGSRLDLPATAERGARPVRGLGGNDVQALVHLDARSPARAEAQAVEPVGTARCARTGPCGDVEHPATRLTEWSRARVDRLGGDRTAEEPLGRHPADNHDERGPAGSSMAAPCRRLGTPPRSRGPPATVSSSLRLSAGPRPNTARPVTRRAGRAGRACALAVLDGHDCGLITHQRVISRGKGCSRIRRSFVTRRAPCSTAVA